MKSPFAKDPDQGDKPTRRPGLLSSLLGGGRTYFVLAGVAALIATAGALAILGRSADRSTYYVLNQDVPARTVITSEMLAEVETSAGTEPPNALTPGSVVTQAIFARVPLAAGDVITSSVAGPLDRIDANLPEGYVVGSFQVLPENAVAGKVRRGDLIDVIAVQATNEIDPTAGLGNDALAKMVLHRVLVLDVTTDPNTIAQGANDTSVEDGVVEPGPESAAIRGGIPQLYVVALSPDDAATLALVRDRNLMVVLSANASPGQMNVEVTESDIFGNQPVGDASAGVNLEAVRGGTVETDPLSGTDPGTMDPDTTAATEATAPVNLVP